MVVSLPEDAGICVQGLLFVVMFGTDILWSLLSCIYYVIESNLLLSQDEAQEQLFFHRHGDTCSPDQRKRVLIKAKGNSAKYKLLLFVRIMPSDVLTV